MAKKKDKPKFEEVLGNLEEIVSELQSGEVGLDDAIERYEKGVKAVRTCHEILKEAEKKIEILMKSSDGSLKAKPFESEQKENEEEKGLF